MVDVMEAPLVAGAVVDTGACRIYVAAAVKCRIDPIKIVHWHALLLLLLLSQLPPLLLLLLLWVGWLALSLLPRCSLLATKDSAMHWNASLRLLRSFWIPLMAMVRNSSFCRGGSRVVCLNALVSFVLGEEVGSCTAVHTHVHKLLYMCCFLNVCVLVDQ